MMAEIHGLCPLQMRVAGQSPVQMPLGRVQQRRHQFANGHQSHPRAIAHKKDEIGCDLVISRASGVQLPPTVPTSSIRCRSIAMWMSSSSGEKTKCPSSNSAAIRSTRQALIAVRAQTKPPERPHPRMRPRLFEILRPKPPVEPNRAIHPLEVRVLGL